MSLTSFSLSQFFVGANQLSSYLCTSRSSDLVLPAGASCFIGFSVGCAATALFFSASLRQGAASFIVLLLTGRRFPGGPGGGRATSVDAQIALISSGVAARCFRTR
ncbi:unnamed protein product [Polarella glacialis]|uniref:Uncharacterized protein n=1 Tax=Polarella glacialis TaxID=89957 RepID=A0A813FGR2_POLGL|nr:unnamed protein product [Polarella glacialis]